MEDLNSLFLVFPVYFSLFPVNKLGYSEHVNKPRLYQILLLVGKEEFSSE